MGRRRKKGSRGNQLGPERKDPWARGEPSKASLSGMPKPPKPDLSVHQRLKARRQRLSSG